METKTVITAAAAVAGALCLYKATKASSKQKQMWVIAAILLLGGAATAALLMGNGAEGQDKSMSLPDESPTPPLTPEKEAQVEAKVSNTVASLPSVTPETETALLNLVMDMATSGDTASAKEEAIRTGAAALGVSPDDAASLISTLRSSTGESGTTFIPPKVSGGKGKDQSKEWATFMVQEDPNAYAIVGLDGKIAGKVLARAFFNDPMWDVQWVGDKPPAGLSLWPDQTKPVGERVPVATMWAAWEALMTEMKKQGVKDKTPA